MSVCKEFSTNVPSHRPRRADRASRPRFGAGADGRTRPAPAAHPQRHAGAGQKCPTSTNGEIVVCSTLDQPYRIPKELRDTAPIAAQNQSWVNRAATVDQVGRVAGGLPDTCSPVGTGGQSGCALARARAYSAERRAQAAGQAIDP
ncbi:hypothetical protein [Sphingomonas aerolata]|uniref:hypothetical protein n=1 Tax=Sphingomonas aerolata TaxID=185951 RepID=UPI002FDFE52D